MKSWDFLSSKKAMVVYAYNSVNKSIGQIEKTDNILQKVV